MDRNSIIGFILIAAILIGYTWYTMPSPEEVARIQREQDSLATLTIEKQGRDAETQLDERRVAPLPDTLSTAVIRDADDVPMDSLEASMADSLRRAAAGQRFGLFAAAAEGTNEEVVIENDRLQISISTHGARPSVIRLKEYTTYHQTPLLLADPDSGTYEFRFFSGNQDISTRDLYFTAEPIGKDAVRLKAATNDPGKFLQITYRLDTATYFLHVNAEFTGIKTEVDPRSLFFHWELTGFNNEKHLPSELQKCGVYYKYFSDDRDYLSETEAEEAKLQGRTNWVAFKQDFFTVAMIREDGFAGNGSEIAV
ncbi:MAG: YidC/Oxa1 family insertase periplasmic-domain containing protein, partial [Flavobacteriales bacterium]